MKVIKGTYPYEPPRKELELSGLDLQTKLVNCILHTYYQEDPPSLYPYHMSTFHSERSEALTVGDGLIQPL